jgi:hypothetical protein
MAYFLSLEYPEIEEVVSKKDNKLLSLLRDVYVDSKDPVPALPVMYTLIKLAVYFGGLRK